MRTIDPGLGVLLLAAALACAKPEAPAPAPPPTLAAPELQVPRGLLVAHALGAIGGVRYTNSLEAFRCNYARGFRWFEVDLSLSSDAELVCFHRGFEKESGLEGPLGELESDELEGKRFAGKFPIAPFSALLAEADRLGDVVLVMDTKSWTRPMLKAFARAARERAQNAGAAKLVLQSYGAKDIGSVSELGKEIGASVILTLTQSDSDDARVEELARQYHVLAIVADTKRFTPWLARRLHAIPVPVLVNTVNEHSEVIEFTRGGADGFYTDRYLPYAEAAKQPNATLECGATEPSPKDLRRWVERDVLRRGEYKFRPCARPGRKQVELERCGPEAAIFGPYFAVPPGQTVHVEFDAEAGASGANLWLDIVHKMSDRPLQPRVTSALAPRERRSFVYDLALPEGSAGVETRVGLASEKDSVTVHRLRISQPLPEAPAAARSGRPDAGR